MDLITLVLHSSLNLFSSQALGTNDQIGTIKHPLLVNIALNERGTNFLNRYSDAPSLIQTSQNLFTEFQKKLAALNSKNNVQEDKAENTKDSPGSLKKIQNLRQTGHLDEAEKTALTYLANYPNDVDADYLLGLIYLQKQNYSKAEFYLKTVLVSMPSYLDARVALIKVKIKKKEYKEARALINDGLKRSPKNDELLSLKKSITFQKIKNRSDQISNARSVLQKQTASEKLIIQAKKYIAEKKYEKAEQIVLNLLYKNPRNVEALIAQADIYLTQRNDLRALFIIQRGLRHSPNNPQLLTKECEIRMLLQNYSLAVESCKQVLKNNPRENQAKELLNTILESRPSNNYGPNAIGVATSNFYVRDLHSIWDYSTSFYTRNTDLGPVSGRINYASRQGISAPQYELDFSPHFNRNIYFDLSAAYADEPALFAKQAYYAEGYFNTPFIPEVSLGARYSDIGFTYFTTYTGSVNFYPGSYWLSLRPFYFVPKNRSSTSVLYTIILRKYFNTDDHYIGISGGAGRSPDLADLLTVNFIVIRNNFITLNYRVPVFKHRVALDFGVGYTNWQYPSEKIRELYNGTFGLTYKF